MTGRLLPAAATAAACIALTGLAIRALAPQQPARTVRPAAGQAISSAAVQTPAALLIRAATQQAQQLLLCPATRGPLGSQSASPTASPATSTSPARGTCGRLTVLRGETGPDTGGLPIVLLICLLQPDPLSGWAAGPPVPMALRLQVSRTPGGALIAQLVEP